MNVFLVSSLLNRMAATVLGPFIQSGNASGLKRRTYSLPWMRSWAQLAVSRILFKRRHDRYEIVAAFSRALVTILDFRSLTNEIVRTFTSVSGAMTASLYVLQKEQDAYLLSSWYGLSLDRGIPLRLQVDDELPKYLACFHSILVREELEHSGEHNVSRSIVTILPQMEAEVCIPLICKDQLVGFCNLGPKTDRCPLSAEDLSLLATLGQQAAIALDNAMLYDDLKRSQALMRRTDRLRSLEIIAGGFAHEIRNPLTSIKTFIQLAPERKDDHEFITHFSRIVSDDVDRIERLIHEILDFARYMEPKFTEEDINEILSSCLYFIEVKARNQAITIRKDLAPDLPRVWLDRQQMKQVLLNLFLNSIDAMGDLGGTLTVRTERVLRASGQVWIQIEVSDTGSGISAENLEQIFNPFFTTKHERGEREGTGLGLAIVHQIIRDHHGCIKVESTVGQGTTFYVSIPGNPLLKDPFQEQVEHEKTNPIGR